MNTESAASGAARIELVQSDITLQDLEAVANAANSKLAGGGGVDGKVMTVLFT